MSDQTASRTRDLSFSSEIEADRWWGGEILDHSPGSVRMDFMQSGRAPLLLFHDQRSIVGVVQKASIGSDRVGRASVRFGRSEQADSALQDVDDDILTNVSVGYRINKMVLDSQDGDREVYRVTDWEPLEVSLVGIPVDPTVGVGRSMGNEALETRSQIQPTQEETMTTATAAAPAAAAAPAVVAAAAETQIDLAGATRAAADAERARAKEIRALAGRHNLGALGDEHVDKGTSIEAFRGLVLEQLSERGDSKPLYQMPGHLGLTEQERQKYSVTRFIRCLLDSIESKRPLPSFERELSDEISKRAQKDSKGMFLPYDVLLPREADTGPSLFKRTLTSSGGVGTGGAVVQSTVAASQYIPPNYNVPMVVQAGARVLPGLQGNILIPKMTSGKSGTWVNPENTAVTSADPTFAQVSLSPKDVGSVVDISRRLLLQSNPAVDGLVRDDIAVAIQLAIDSGAISGSGSSGQPTGVLNQSGLGVAAVGTNGGAWTWTLVTQNVQNVAAANRLMEDGTCGWLMSAQAWAHGQRTVKVSGFPQFLINPDRPTDLMLYPIYRSQQVPFAISKGTGTNLTAAIFGHWSDLLIGEWGVLDLLVDPYTFSNTGAIRIRVFQTVDVAVRYGAAFSTTNDIAP